jgi:hypothetical protein
MYGGPQLSSDGSNTLQLGSPWNGYYDGQAFIGGTRYYMHGETGATPVAVADNVPVFLVYRLDFGSGTTADSVHLWVNPVPGTQPSDASANVTWTLPSGVHFAFTDNVVKLRDSTYYNQVTYDELRLGTTYYSVAPDPVVLPNGPSMPAIPAGNTSNPRESTHYNTATDDGLRPAKTHDSVAPSIAVSSTADFNATLSSGRSVFDERPEIQPFLAGARRPDASTKPTDDADSLNDAPSFWAE